MGSAATAVLLCLTDLRAPVRRSAASLETPPSSANPLGSGNDNIIIIIMDDNDDGGNDDNDDIDISNTNGNGEA